MANQETPVYPNIVILEPIWRSAVGAVGKEKIKSVTLASLLTADIRKPIAIKKNTIFKVVLLRFAVFVKRQDLHLLSPIER